MGTILTGIKQYIHDILLKSKVTKMETILAGIQKHIQIIKEYVFVKDAIGNYPDGFHKAECSIMGAIIGPEFLNLDKPSENSASVLAVISQMFHVVTIGNCDGNFNADGTESGGYSILILRPIGDIFQWCRIDVLIVNPDRDHFSLIFAHNVISEEEAIEFMLLESVKRKQVKYQPWFGFAQELNGRRTQR